MLAVPQCCPSAPSINSACALDPRFEPEVPENPNTVVMVPAGLILKTAPLVPVPMPPAALVAHMSRFTACMNPPRDPHAVVPEVGTSVVTTAIPPPGGPWITVPWPSDPPPPVVVPYRIPSVACFSFASVGAAVKLKIVVSAPSSSTLKTVPTLLSPPEFVVPWKLPSAWRSSPPFGLCPNAAPVLPVKFTSVVSTPAVVILKTVPRPVPLVPPVWVVP